LAQAELAGQLVSRDLIAAVMAVGGIDEAGVANLVARIYGLDPAAPLPPTLPFHLAFPSGPGEGLRRPVLAETEQIVPGLGLPPELLLQQANNNLDVVRHDDGRVYLAFRSAPNHFASADATIQVISSADGQRWDFEARFALGTACGSPACSPGTGGCSSTSRCSAPTCWTLSPMVPKFQCAADPDSGVSRRNYTSRPLFRGGPSSSTAPPP
jgi:hypothetical protein